MAESCPPKAKIYKGEIKVDLFLILVFLMIYFLPAIVAKMRGHKNFPSIAAFNLFLGWTFLGWVIAFVWCLSYSGVDHGRV